MSIISNLTRNSCSGALWKALKNQSRVFGNRGKILIAQKEMRQLTLKPISTSQHVLSSSAAQDHSHSKIWTAERFLSAGLVGLLPISLAFPNPALDYALALALTIHVHWGVEAIVVDYIRPNVVGATLSKAAVVGVYALSVLTLAGLFYFNLNDVGLCQAIRMLWTL